MVHAAGFRDLLVYRKAKQSADRIYEITKTFPKEETYSLTDQLRRSSRSIGAQVAEAWAKRRYRRHFISKLTDADAELQETKHWLDIAVSSGCLLADEAAQLDSELSEIGRMLNGMIQKAQMFCMMEQHSDH